MSLHLNTKTPDNQGIWKLIYGVKSYQYHLFLTLCIGLISFVSYNLGKIDALEKKPLKITESSVVKSGLRANIYEVTSPREEGKQGTAAQKPSPKKLDTRVVASKNSDKYHHTWCSGGKRIKEENQVWFNSAEEAEGRGYTLAGNCEP